MGGGAGGGEGLGHGVVGHARARAVAADGGLVGGEGKRRLGRPRRERAHRLASGADGWCGVRRRIHGEGNGEIVGVGVGGGIQAAHVERIAPAVDEAGDGRRVGGAAGGGEGLGHGVVGHARARAVAAGGGLVGGEGERRLGRPRRERAHRLTSGADGWRRVGGRRVHGEGDGEIVGVGVGGGVQAAHVERVAAAVDEAGDGRGVGGGAGGGEGLGHGVVGHARARAVAADGGLVGGEGKRRLGRPRRERAHRLASGADGWRGVRRRIHGEGNGEIVGIGVGGGIQAAHVERVAATVDEAGDRCRVGGAAGGSENQRHGVVGHAGTRAVAAGGGLVGGEGERRLGRPRRECARGPAPGADGWCRVSGRRVDGEGNGEIVGVGVGGGIQAAHVESVAAAVDEAGHRCRVGRAAGGGEGLGHGVVRHAGARAVTAGGGLAGGEGERRLGRPSRERARGPAPGADGWCRVNGRQLNIHDGGGARGDADRLHHGDVARLRKPDVIVAWREDHLVSAVPSPAAVRLAVRKGDVEQLDPGLERSAAHRVGHVSGD